MRNLSIGLIVLGFLFISELAIAQQERVVNWDFTSGVTGTITFRDGNAWNEFELPMRALPLLVEVAISLSCFVVRNGQLGGALLILIGFDCVLRTGELLSLIF
mgnify:CR=1 FL=1